MAITVSYILLVIFLLSWFILLVPFIINQLSDLINIFIGKANTIQSLLHDKNLDQLFASIPFIPKTLRAEILNMLSDPTTATQIKLQLEKSLAQFSSAWKDYAQSLGTVAVSMISNIVASLTKSSIVLTLAILFSVEKISVMKFISSLGWEKKFKYIYMKLERIYKQLGIWLKQRLLLSLYIWIATYIALVIAQLLGMDIPNKLSISVILWLLDIVPYIGPVIGWVPAALIASIHFGFFGFLVMSWIVTIINFIENNILIPVMMNKSLGINSVVIFISMILWGIIMWFIGILLAVPIAAIVTLLFEKELTD